MHESTVSRATSNKYIPTPRGLFEMKYFFTASIASGESGEAHSAEAVRQKIRQMIEAESPATCLSDDEIVERNCAGRHRRRPPHGREIPRQFAKSPRSVDRGAS